MDAIGADVQALGKSCNSVVVTDLVNQWHIKECAVDHVFLKVDMCAALPAIFL